jgi:hypothetical protein
MSARSPIKALAIAREDGPQGKLRDALSISAARKRRQREKARDRHMPAFFRSPNNWLQGSYAQCRRNWKARTL